MVAPSRIEGGPGAPIQFGLIVAYDEISGNIDAATNRNRQLVPRRVGEGVAPLAPHRSGRADFPHPVPHERDSFQLV
jgi:hypothetical protein